MEFIIKSIVKKVDRYFLIKPIDLFLTHFCNSSQYITKGFIRMDVLGDNFVFFPFLLKYKELYPNAFWIVNRSIYILYKLLNIKCISIHLWKFRWNPIYRFQILRKLLFMEFDFLINIVPHRAQLEGDEILKLLRAKEKICYGNDFILWRNQNNKICSTVISYDYNYQERKLSYIHIFKHERNFFEKLTGIRLAINVREFYINSLNKLKEILPLINISKGKKYIVIITDAGSPFRKYKTENWQVVLNNLPKNLKIIQLGLNKFPLQHPNLIDLTGKTSLEEAMSIVINASLVIGNETGLTHLAYLSGIPTVCILGGGHFGRFLPWPEFEDVVKCVYKPMDCFQCGWKCKYVNLQKGEVPPCILQIPPESILEAVEELNEEYKIFV